MAMDARPVAPESKSSGYLPRTTSPAHQQVEGVRQRLSGQKDERFVRERTEMQQTQDLTTVDDDVEKAATLMEWRAPEHKHQPKTMRWNVIMGIGALIILALLLWLANIMAVITVGLAFALFYYLGHRHPGIIRYRIMVDGVSFNTMLYHYKNLEAFNIVYEPGDVKVVLIRSKRWLLPLITMEIGDADPVAIRNYLLEFLPEDETMEEPLPDFWARQLGF